MDSDRTTMLGSAADASAAESCPACTTSISVGEDFCPKCGYQRGTWKERAASGNGAVPVSSAGVVATAATGPALWTLSSSSGESYPLRAGTLVIGRGDVDVQIA